MANAPWPSGPIALGRLMAVIEDLQEIELSPNQYVSFTVITGIADEVRTNDHPAHRQGPEHGEGQAPYGRDLPRHLSRR